MGPVFAVNFLEFVGESVPDGATNGDPHNDNKLLLALAITLLAAVIAVIVLYVAGAIPKWQ